VSHDSPDRAVAAAAREIPQREAAERDARVDQPPLRGAVSIDRPGGRDVLGGTAPGTLWPWVKLASWVELMVFAALCFFWLAPGFDKQAMVFGWAHGIGFIGLCLLIWVAIRRREAPYTLLAATLTPVGPLGSVIAIEAIDRRRARDSAA
jgi:hypothetical protein